MRIDIEEIQLLLSQIQEFNRLDLNTLDFYENGVILPITQEIKDEFKFIGLNNTGFIDLRYWENRLESSQTKSKENKDGQEFP